MRDTDRPHITSPDDPLVCVLEDMGAHGISAATYSLSYAVTLAADFEAGEGGNRITDIRYVTGQVFGDPVADFAAMVADELAERADNDADRVARQWDYYACLGVHHRRIW